MSIFPEYLRPIKPFDLIDRVDEYIAFIREGNDNEKVFEELKSYLWSYLRDVSLDKEKLKLLGAIFTDLVYQYANKTKSIDLLIRPYCATVFGYFYDRLRDRGIDIFYMLDNDFSTCDHRCQLTSILFEASGFAVVSPHKLWHGDFAKIETTKERHERLLLEMPELSINALDSAVIPFEKVEEVLKHNMSVPVGIIYVEKNSDADYLMQVKRLVLQSDYTFIYRHEGYESKNFELFQ